MDKNHINLDPTFVSHQLHLQSVSEEIINVFKEHIPSSTHREEEILNAVLTAISEHKSKSKEEKKTLLERTVEILHRYSICYWNVNGGLKKPDKIEKLRKLQNCEILCITEHRLIQDGIRDVKIPDYKLVSYYSRSEGKGKGGKGAGGGVSIYCKEAMNVIERKEFVNLSVPHLAEICAIECIDLGVIVVGLYRPPVYDCKLFLQKLIEIEKISKNINLPIYIVGDMNVDLSGPLPQSPQTKDLSDVLNTAGLKPIINFTTRKSGTKNKCIDHAYTNVHINWSIQAESIRSDLSDHYGVKLTVEPNNSEANPVSYKRFNIHANIKGFLNSINSHDWEYMLNETQCPMVILNNVFTKIKYYFDIHFQLTEYEIRNNVEGWISDRALKLSKKIKTTKYKLMEIEQQHDSSSLEKLTELEKKYSTEINSIVMQSIDNLLSKYENISRRKWQQIASEIGYRNKSSALYAPYAATAVQINQSCDNANNSSALEPCVDIAMSYLSKFKKQCTTEFNCEPFNLTDVIETFEDLKSKNSKDIKDINTRIFDYLRHLIFKYEIFCKLFNQCLQAGNFPITKVTPMFVKVIDRLMSNRLMKFFRDFNSLNPQQYALQPGRSNLDATRDVVHKVMSSLDGNKHTAAIFFDLSLALELVSPKLLLAKLKYYGINGSFLKMITCYLSNRKKITNVHDIKSESLQLDTIAVPQLSILENILFLILMNDLTLASTEAEYVMYADKCCLVISAESANLQKEYECKKNKKQSDPEFVKYFSLFNNKVIRVIKKVTSWLSANGIALDKKQINVVDFRLKPRIEQIVCNEQATVVDSVTFLGFTINRKLTWGPQIDITCIKLSSAFYEISRLNKILKPDNEQAKKLAYHAYDEFHSVLTYGIEFLGLGRESDRERMIDIQLRAIASLPGVKVEAEELCKMTKKMKKKLFQDHSILTLTCEQILQAAIYIFIRKPVEDHKSHDHNTRYRPRIALPKWKKARGEHLIDYVGVSIYNRLPSSIISADSTAKFSDRLRKFLLEKAYLSLKEFYDDNKIPKASSPSKNN